MFDIMECTFILYSKEKTKVTKLLQLTTPTSPTDYK